MRIINNSTEDSVTGCWLWNKRINPDGYGEMGYLGKKERSHRVSALEFCAEDIKGKVVMHMCDTPACVNPFHLEVGTQLANIKDRHSKGRTARAEQKGHHSWEQVNEARRLAEEEGMSRKEIAVTLGFKTTALQAILTYKSWVPSGRMPT